MLAEGVPSSMVAAHQSSSCSTAPKPAIKGLAAALKQALSPRGSKTQHLTPSSSSKQQGGEMRHWLCGCAAARSNSSITSARADAYLEAPLVVNRHSSCAASSILVLDGRTENQAAFFSPPSVVNSSGSNDAADWKSVNGSDTLLSSRQLSCKSHFSSYNSSVVFEEKAADAAWRDFMSWRLKWMEVASQQRFSYREADLQRHEADLVQRLQHGSTITLCTSDHTSGGMRTSSSFTSFTSTALASVPPVNAAQSMRDWEMFLELPDFVASRAAQRNGSSSGYTPCRRCRIVHSSISSAGQQ